MRGLAVWGFRDRRGGGGRVEDLGLRARTLNLESAPQTPNLRFNLSFLDQ